MSKGSSGRGSGAMSSADVNKYWNGSERVKNSLAKKYGISGDDKETVATKLLVKASTGLKMPRSIEKEIQKWGTVRKSPYGNSFYNTKGKTWEHTPEGSLRVADHWNFVSEGEKHAVTDRPIKNNTHWTIAKFSKEKYRVIKSLRITK